MRDRLRAAGAYVLMPVSSLVVLLAWRQNPEVRFHAVQGLIVGVGLIVVNRLLNALAFVVQEPLGTLVGLVGALVAVVSLALWGALIVFAWNGNAWRVPLVGDFAAQQAGRLE